MAAKRVLMMFMPYILAIGGILLAAFIFLSIIQGFLSSGTVDDRLTKQQNSSLRAQLIQIVDDVNNQNTFDEKGNRIGELVDYFSNDDDLKLNYVYVQAYINYFNMFINDKKLSSIEELEAEIKDRFKKAAEELKPKFVYRKEVITLVKKWATIEVVMVKVPTPKGAPPDSVWYESRLVTHNHVETSNQDIYILVSAETIKGKYEITYKTETTHSQINEDGVNKDVTTTKPSIDEFKQTDKDYDKFKSIILAKNPKDQIDLSMTLILNSALNYMNYSDNMDWVFADIMGFDSFGAVSSSVVPANLLSFFKNAETEFGIPWWYLAGQSFTESSFIVGNENTSSHCFGLMQSDPRNWLAIGPKLGYKDIEALQKKYNFPGRSWNDISIEERSSMVLDLRLLGYGENAEAQIRMGAYQLKGLIKKQIDWTQDIYGLENDLYDVLNFYSGNGGEAYAMKVLGNAFKFKEQTDLAYSPKWPCPTYFKITSPFGLRFHPIYKVYKMHTGIDIGAPENALVVSAMNGTVTNAGTKGSYGICVVVDDGKGYQTYYAHLKSASVNVGVKVQVGQEVGKVDSTGASTGNHLHFEVRQNDEPIDPVTWLNSK